jgi:hypothetical protein
MMKHLTTYIYLPPGVPPGSVIREFLRQAFEAYHWFQPVKYGRAALTGRLDPAHVDFDALVGMYERYSDLTVTAQTDRDHIIIFPAKPSDPPYTGKITWTTSIKKAVKPEWRANHLRQVFEVMQLVGSPLAQAGSNEDLDSKKWRLVPDPSGLSATERYTVRDYSEGLAGLFWRNFFGPPFVQMFGERLIALPSESKQELGDGIVLVQPYELPSLAGTPEGVERERQLIAHLGPECFYDHERQLKPTRRPEQPLPG